MKKKILLISANQLGIPYPVYPLGVSYLKTYIQNKLPDIEIGVFDFIDKNYTDFAEFLNVFQPDYVGISLRNIDDVNIYKKESYVQHYKSIIENTRKFSKSKIILGGAGFSIFPEIIFNYLNPDFGIFGEGEEQFYKLIVALENSIDYSQIENLLYKKNASLFFNKKNQSIKKLELQFEPALLDYYWHHSGMLNIQTKRGCPYNCIYCTYPLIEGHNVRTLDIDRIIETLSDLSNNKKIDYVFFTDSIFNINNDYNIELAENIIKNKINIHWGAYFNFCNLDEKILHLFQRAGLRHIEFGTESLSDTMLRNYNKPFNLSEIFNISNICIKLGIDYAHFLILGGYGETAETLSETFANSKKMDKTIYFPFIGMRIYPGTRLCEIALEEKKIAPTDNLLSPTYYISDKIDLIKLKEDAIKTGKRWVFPDDDLSKVMNKMRDKNKKGPLWEYLIS
jgi:radical SAM superfamily enzyme YgiQ (UPF0313 family)